MKNKKMISLISLLIILSGFLLLLKNISLGSKSVYLDYLSKNILVPKNAFNYKVSDNNISIKSLQSFKTLNNELNDILSNYKKITCNDKGYYYNEHENYSIIDYGINKHYVFNTLHIKYSNFNYCDYLKLEEYTEQLAGYARMHTFSGKDNNLQVMLIIRGFDNHIKFEASMSVKYKGEVLESSNGTFVIEDNILTFTRDEMLEQSSQIKIPEISSFKIVEAGVLQLNDNYLSKYDNEIVLK